MMRGLIKNIGPLIVILIAVFSSCKEEVTVVPATTPDNPYDTIDYGGNVPNDSVDAASFVLTLTNVVFFRGALLSWIDSSLCTCSDFVERFPLRRRRVCVSSYDYSP